MTDKIKKALLIVAGLLCVGLGALGIVLPLLPTTPLLLLAAFLFARSSENLRQWLLHHKVFGKYIYNYTVHKAIPKKSKVIAITTLWLTMALSMILSGKLIVFIILPIIGTSVTVHLLRLKTLG